MKKNLIKKVFAVSLSIAMACSFLPAANPVTASAAAPYVSLKTTFKTLKVGQKYKMTLKNNKISWKIKKVETTDKTIATVYGKTTSQVMIKGKSEGRATIRVKVQTSKRKANNTKTLRCRVKVVKATPTVDPTTPVQTDATVTTQAELDTALKDSKITKITIKPTAAVNFVIASGSYANVDLIVDAPQSDIENNATFKSITINNIKSETWTEKGTGNTFSILAKAARLIVDKAATVKNITIGTTDAKIDLVSNGGTINGVNVTAKATLTIKGTAATTALIPVIFGVNAKDSVFTTELPVAVSMSANIELVFEKGAAKSTVKLEVSGITATVTNRTGETIAVTKNDNSVQNILNGTVKGNVNATNATTPVTPGTSTGGSTTGSGAAKLPTTQMVNTGAGIWATVSGTAYGVEKVSGSAIHLEVGNITTTPAAYGSTLEYSIRAKAQDGSWSKSLRSGDMSYSRDYEENSNKISKDVYYMSYDLDITGAPFGKNIDIVFECNVKATDKYAASAKATQKIVTLNIEAGGDAKHPTIISQVSGSANSWSSDALISQ